MRKRKKWMGFITMILVCLLMGVSEPQYVGAKDSDFEILVTLIDGGLDIREYKDVLENYKGKDKVVKIPDRFRVIGSYAFSGNKNIQTVIIPKTITTIEENAFDQCKNLKKVVFEKGSKLKTIDNYAFAGCKNIQAIELPDSVEQIGEWAFSDCSKMESVKFPKGLRNIDEGAFNSCKSLKEVEMQVKEVKLIKETFRNCTNLKKVRVKAEGKVTIEEPDEQKIYSTYYYGVFDDCKKLESVEISGKNIVIKENAFRELPLKTLKVSGNEISVDKNAFRGCKKLQTAVLSGNMQEIEANTFYGCDNLASFEIPKSVKTIKEEAFACSGLKKIVIPESVKKIEKGALSGCSRLENIEFENASNVDLSDGWSIFEGTPGANVLGDEDETVIYHGYLFSIGSDCVNEDGILVIPSDVKCICVDALVSWWEEWTGTIWKLVIPSSVEKICDDAFYGCENLKEVEINENTQIKGNPFSNTEFANKQLKKSGFLIVNHSLLDVSSNLKGRVKIPEGVKNIQGEVCGLRNVKEWVFPSTLEIIESRAFAEGGVEKVICNKNLREIGDEAFFDCESLKTVVLNDNLQKIGNNAFIQCTMLKKVTLGKNLREIGDGAFRDCDSLKTVTFNKKLERIGDYAFYDTCMSVGTLDLSNIRYMGQYAFAGDIKIKKMVIGKYLKQLNYCTLDCVIDQLTVSSGVKKIDSKCFYTGMDYRVALLNCKENSAIHKYAKKQGVKCKFNNNL